MCGFPELKSQTRRTTQLVLLATKEKSYGLFGNEVHLSASTRRWHLCPCKWADLAEGAHVETCTCRLLGPHDRAWNHNHEKENKNERSEKCGVIFRSTCVFSLVSAGISIAARLISTSMVVVTRHQPRIL